MAAKVGLDLDGCLANWVDKFCERTTKVIGKNNWPSNWYTESTWHTNPLSWNFASDYYTKEELKKVYEDIGEDGRFWYSLEVLPNLEPLIDWTHDAQYCDIYYISHRTGRFAKNQTELWLRDKMRKSYPTVLLTEQKGMAAATLSLDCYIDDKAENCNDVRMKSPNTHTYLLIRPYNRGINLKDGIIEVNEVMDMIKEERL